MPARGTSSRRRVLRGQIAVCFCKRIAPLRLRGTTLLLADFLDHPMATQAVEPPTPMDGPLEGSFPEKDGDRQQFIDWQQPQGAQPGFQG